MRIFLLFVLCARFTTSAATWYVDNAAAGAATGTSWTDAWPSFSNVVWGVSGVTAGDTLFISGGSTSKTYTETWAIGDNGTTNNPITIRVGQDAGHNGTVIFDYDALGDYAAVTGLLVTEEWVKLDGEVNSASHWQFANLRNITNRSTGYAIGGYLGSGFEARFLTFTNCNHGIRMSTTDYGKIYNCTFQGIRGDAAITLFHNGATNVGSSLIYSNSIGLAFNNAAPPGKSDYAGPDGIQGNSGLSIFNNTFRIEWKTNIFTSNQHPDFLQVAGWNMRVYNNEFVNIGDSAIDLNASSASGMQNVWVYNNVFRIETAIDTYPEYIRLYGHVSAPIGAVSNLFIMNNTFVDLDNWTMMRLERWNNTNVAIGGNRIQNNLFIRCGNGAGRQTWRIENYTNYTAGDWLIGNNVYWHPTPADAIIAWLGTEYVAPVWLAQEIESNSTTNAPTFVSYTAFSPDNNLRLAAVDTVARNAGANLNAFFTTDYTGTARGATWDIGAYEYVPSGVSKHINHAVVGAMSVGP